MRTREDQIADLAIKIEGCFSEPPYYAAEKIILEAERRAEQRARAEMSVGYIFHNPDTGTEILPYHPVESGECLDAQDIRQATAEVLMEKLVSTWEEMANEHREREKRGEESRKDSERLDWLAAQFKTTTVYMSGDAIYAPSRLLFSLKGRGFRDAIDAARENAND